MSQENPAPQNPSPPADSSRHIPWKAYASMIAATFFWASNAVAVKIALMEFPIMATASFRVSLAATTLAVLYTSQGGRFRWRAGEARIFFLLSLPGMAMAFLFFTLGLHHTSVSHGVFIASLIPLAVLLLARLDGQERITPLKLTGLLLSLVGILLLAFDQTGGPGPSRLGDFFVGCGVCCFAFFTTRAKRVASAYSSLQFNTYCFLSAAFWYTPFLLWQLARLPWSQITWVGWTSLLYAGTLGSAGAYVAYYFALRLMAASRAAAFHYLQPVVASTLAVVLLQETWTRRFGMGAAFILTGVFLAQRR